MYKDRLNKIPQPRTIARHYAEGKYCDYPADIVLSAVNSHDYEYNPTAIPIKPGFLQMFNANFRAFLYLSEHGPRGIRSVSQKITRNGSVMQHSTADFILSRVRTFHDNISPIDIGPVIHAVTFYAMHNSAQKWPAMPLRRCSAW